MTFGLRISPVNNILNIATTNSSIFRACLIVEFYSNSTRLPLGPHILTSSPKAIRPQSITNAMNAKIAV